MEYFKGQRLLLIWDGASYHCSKELKKFLAEVNEGYPQDQWRIHCVRLAPNQPKQNPIEDVWLQGKNWLRRHTDWKPSFSHTKQLFELFFSLDIFDFFKIHMYRKFLKIK